MSGPFTHITNIETQNIYLGFFFPIPSLFLCIFTHGRNIPDSQKQSQTYISFPKICAEPEVSIPQSSMPKGCFYIEAAILVQKQVPYCNIYFAELQVSIPQG